MIKEFYNWIKTWMTSKNPAKITTGNLSNFFEAKTKSLQGWSFLEDHEKEQVFYRALITPTCYRQGSCVECGCNTKDLELYLGSKGCKKEEDPCFPDMMDKTSWELFKISNVEIPIDHLFDVLNGRNNG